jgi:rhamnosyltransferase
MTSLSRVAAVVTAFEPGPALEKAVRSVVGQVAHVVVVDDGSDGGASALEACRELGATVVRHDTNRGIGAALNTGVHAVRRLDPAPTHVLTLDQDSALPPGFVAGLSAAEGAARDAGVRVGMTSPGVISTVRRGGVGAAAAFERGGEPIQSGLLVPAGVLDAVGGFDDDLVIDGVDTDFWLRARDLGFTAVVAPAVTLEHRLGNPLVLPGGRRLPLTVANEFRYYYQWRNLVHLVRRHGRRHPRWAAGATLRAVRHLVIVTVLAPGREGRLREAYAGLRAGLRSVTGPRPPEPSGD